MYLQPIPTLFANVRPLRAVRMLLALLVVLNCGFLGLRLAQTFIPKQAIIEEVRRGVRLGTLSWDDYPSNYLIGFDQWTDCLALELASVGADTRLTEALAPEVLSPTNAAGRCPALVGFVYGGFRPSEPYTYTRFWHGYSTVLAYALQVMPLQAYRGLLSMLCYGAVAFAACAAALAGARILRMLLPLLVAGFAFTGLPQFGPLVSHSPAFIAMWTLAGVLLLMRQRLSSLGVLGMALLFGALEAFLDAMILCPLSAGLAVIFANAAYLERLDRAPFRQIALFNGAVVLAWGLGFAGTYIFKLAATMAVLGFDPVITPFIDQLMLRMGPASEGASTFFGRLYDNLWRIGYGDHDRGDDQAGIAAGLLVTVMAVGWASAIARFVGSWRRGAPGFRLGGAFGFLLASAMLLGWCVVFREHTARHAFFVVRTTILWIAGGWCWFLAQRAAPVPYPYRSEVPVRVRART